MRFDKGAKFDAGPVLRPATADTKFLRRLAIETLERLIDGSVGRDFWGDVGVELHIERGQLTEVKPTLHPAIRA